MNNEDFNNFLKSKLYDKNINLNDNPPQMETKDINDVAIFLKEEVKYLNTVEVKSLNKHVEFGKDLTVAKQLFRTEKKKNKLNISWQKWIVDNVHISPAYARQHIEVFNLCGTYHKLRDLAMTYTELFRLKNKIRSVFSKNESIADFWRV